MMQSRSAWWLVGAALYPFVAAAVDAEQPISAYAAAFAVKRWQVRK